MNNPKYYDKEASKESHYNNKKEKRKGTVKKFFELFRFKEDENYFEY